MVVGTIILLGKCSLVQTSDFFQLDPKHVGMLGCLSVNVLENGDCNRGFESFHMLKKIIK